MLAVLSAHQSVPSICPTGYLVAHVSLQYTAVTILKYSMMPVDIIFMENHTLLFYVMLLILLLIKLYGATTSFFSFTYVFNYCPRQLNLSPSFFRTTH